MNFIATKKPIGHGHGAPPDSFLETIVNWARKEDETVFAPNDNYDIYTLIRPALGPWESPLHRRAALCEVLRVLPGDESDWHWNEGRDTTAGVEKPDEMEAGAFQVSYNSKNLGADLQRFLMSQGINDPWTFQSRIKADPILDLAYTARLLREPYKGWDGPINHGWIAAQVDADAVKEFIQLLS